MTIAYPSTPSFSASFGCKRASDSCISNRLTRFPSVAFTRPHHHHNHHRQSLPCVKPLSIASRLISLRLCQNGDVMYELQREGWQGGSPVFVKLPVDVVDPMDGQLRRQKVMAHSFHALALAGVKGVVLEIWWGLVEREAPGVYNWQGYVELVTMAKRFGLKVRAVMAFHQFGTGPADPH